MRTHITLVVDRSGSMSRIQSDAQGAVNSFLDEQSKVDGVADVLLADFDSQESFRVALDGGLATWKPYTLSPRGMTPLYDAIGRGINETEQRVARSGADKVIVVIVTDGGENSSREFTRDSATALIKAKEAAGWEFVFLAAGQEAWVAAQAFAGTTMHFSNTINMTSTAGSYAGGMRSASASVARSRGGETVAYAAVVDDSGEITNNNNKENTNP